MTTNRKAPVQTRVTSRTAAVKFYGHTVVEGWPALAVIAIIMIVRAVKCLTCLTFRFLAWLLPILFAFTLRMVAEFYVAAREAFERV